MNIWQDFHEVVQHFFVCLTVPLRITSAKSVLLENTTGRNTSWGFHPLFNIFAFARSVSHLSGL